MPLFYIFVHKDPKFNLPMHDSLISNIEEPPHNSTDALIFSQWHALALLSLAAFTRTPTIVSVDVIRPRFDMEKLPTHPNDQICIKDKIIWNHREGSLS